MQRNIIKCGTEGRINNAYQRRKAEIPRPDKQT